MEKVMSHDQAASELHVIQLFDACFAGTVQGILQIISSGANVNSKDSLGYTPLMYALPTPCLTFSDDIQ